MIILLLFLVCRHKEEMNLSSLLFLSLHAFADSVCVLPSPASCLCLTSVNIMKWRCQNWCFLCE